MKTLISGAGGVEFILDEAARPVKDENGDFIPENTEDENYNVKHVGYIYSVDCYVPTKDNRFIKLSLSAGDIKNIHARILEVEKKETYEFFDA